MGKQRILKTAAGLMIGAGIFNIVWAAAAIAGIFDPKDLIRFTWAMSPIPYFGVAAGFTGKTTISDILVLVYLVGILFSIAGGIFFWFSRSTLSCVVGTIGALLCLPLMGLASVIFTVMARFRSNG